MKLQLAVAIDPCLYDADVAIALAFDPNEARDADGKWTAGGNNHTHLAKRALASKQSRERSKAKTAATPESAADFAARVIAHEADTKAALRAAQKTVQAHADNKAAYIKQHGLEKYTEVYNALGDKYKAAKKARAFPPVILGDDPKKWPSPTVYEETPEGDPEARKKWIKSLSPVELSSIYTATSTSEGMDALKAHEAGLPPPNEAYHKRHLQYMDIYKKSGDKNDAEYSYDELIAAHNAALDRAPKFKGVVYRGLGLTSPGAADKFVAAHPTGSEMALKSFAPSSRAAEQALRFGAGDVVLRIMQHSGAELGKVSRHESEKEVTLRKGTKYKILAHHPKSKMAPLYPNSPLTHVIDIEEV